MQLFYTTIFCTTYNLQVFHDKLYIHTHTRLRLASIIMNYINKVLKTERS